jgi:hypothetical protein
MFTTQSVHWNKIIIQTKTTEISFRDKMKYHYVRYKRDDIKSSRGYLKMHLPV